ncbi:MAG: ATP-binding cassette domain-containing protein [Solirubrobacteraceae bacterium]
MSLLELTRVSKTYPGAGAPVLEEVSATIEAGELAVVWGLRHSGRSTLLRIAAGLEPPDGGVVRFEGRDVAVDGERLLGEQIGYCQKLLPFGEGESALDHAMVGLLSRWVSTRQARVRARQALARAGVEDCARMRRVELSGAEAVRVALARTLALQPRLLVIDEPVYGVELADRDGILALLRGLADDGVAVLSSTGESTGLSEADRGFSLGAGELRGTPARTATVLPLRALPPTRASA